MARAIPAADHAVSRVTAVQRSMAEMHEFKDDMVAAGIGAGVVAGVAASAGKAFCCISCTSDQL